MALRNKKNKKFGKPINVKAKLTRKEERKLKRKEKKVRRNEHYVNRKKPGQFVLNPTTGSFKSIDDKPLSNANVDKTEKCIENVIKTNKVLTTEQLRGKEKKEQLRIEKEMLKQRNKQLLEANFEEDRNIRHLEKQLKLNKRKSKSIPKSFAEDGLDYLLEICDSEAMKAALTSEQEINEGNEEFKEDFALMANKTDKKEDFEDFLNEDDGSDQEMEEYEDDSEENDGLDYDLEDEVDIDESCSDNIYESDDEKSMSQKKLNSKRNLKPDVYDTAENMSETDDDRMPKKIKQKKKKKKSPQIYVEETEEINDNSEIDNNKGIQKKELKKTNLKSNKFNDSIEETFDAEESDIKNKTNGEIVKKTKKAKRKKEEDTSPKTSKRLKGSHKDSVGEESGEDYNDLLLNDEEAKVSDNEVEHNVKGIVKRNSDGTWEDIYGRLRNKDGAVLNKKEEKYIPPAVRAKMEANILGDTKRLEKLNRLQKQLKGLLNRLAESNMHSIATQIEDLYMNNSRNDMNDSLTNLIMGSLISKVITPERLLIEHVVLVTILHANVGTEVGAHFLQTVIKKIHEYSSANHDVENKMMDNTVSVIAQLYNFKLFDSKLIYEILKNLSEKFGEKDIECILCILRNIGFALRKDDPLELKNLILNLQKQASNASDSVKDNPRVKFMLDILLAIKNNNVSKIPNYDTSYPDHLKKVMKGFIRKGNYVTNLNISYEDLLKANERGKWWVVGSAWTGSTTENSEKSNKPVQVEGFSKKLLDLAAKQRMNTDVRRNIFCIIMSAEDYMDAFEKLLHLGLKNQQEREIINIILQCCLRERVYNPYYAVLAQKFCDYDRRFQMTIKYSVWDKLKSLSDHSGSQISNLAKLLAHLFIEKGLPISTLKVVQFSELDKITLRFMRQTLLGILLHKETEDCLFVFEKVAQSDKLKMFRESLRLFIHHFLLKNLKSENVPEEQKVLLETRAKMIEKVLISKEGKLRF